MASRIDRRLLDINLAILGFVNEPAENPAIGAQYIVGSEPTGTFANAAVNSIARYDGTNWTFTKPRAGLLEVLNVNTGEIFSFNGTNWISIASLGGDGNFIKPVLNILPSGSTLPENATIGDKFLNTTDNKIYTATDENTWDEGVAIADGQRYASNDGKIYESNKVSNIPDGGMFLNKADNSLYVYNSTTSSFSKPKAEDELITETHTLTAEEVSAKSFSLSHNIAQGSENKVLLFISGVNQVVGIDFSASGNAISWANKALDTIGLFAGDVIVIQYIKS